ncbi:MAG: hypothetical protein ABL927_15340, partial [Bdellovibrionales bacterium]
FKGAELGQVSGLLNLFRQVGGSMGVALVATLLSYNSHQNYLDLTSKISLLNPVAQTEYVKIKNAFVKKPPSVTGMGTSHDVALRVIHARIENQVFMLSFNQVIWTIMIIFSLSYIPLYLLKLRLKPKGPIDAH